VEGTSPPPQFTDHFKSPNPKSSMSPLSLPALALTIALLSTPLALAQSSPWFTPASGNQTVAPANNPATVWQDLATADVIYLGEVHDQMADHQAQLEILQTLQVQKPKEQKVAIALEMVQRPYQPWLDQYLAGAIDEATLRQKTEYDTRWGYDWEGYAPIFRFAKANQIPMIALNLPSELTRHIARNGFDNLPAEHKQWLPDTATLRNDNPDYRAMLQSVYAGMHQGHGSSFTFANFERVQIAWDDGMAGAIADYRKANPNTQVVVLVGNGHVVFGHGIPSRVARRLPQIEQRKILLNPDAEMQEEKGIADYFWRSPTRM
jgi:uncharacterized iron-regulated protein